MFLGMIVVEENVSVILPLVKWRIWCYFYAYFVTSKMGRPVVNLLYLFSNFSPLFLLHRRADDLLKLPFSQVTKRNKTSRKGNVNVSLNFFCCVGYLWCLIFQYYIFFLASSSYFISHLACGIYSVSNGAMPTCGSGIAACILLTSFSMTSSGNKKDERIKKLIISHIYAAILYGIFLLFVVYKHYERLRIR